MEGSYFSNNCGGLEEGGKRVQNIAQFERCVEKLVVVARSTPENKYLLVTGLKELGDVVAVTGSIITKGKYLFR
jgi:magnesium-transporting ATPase (P-type)